MKKKKSHIIIAGILAILCFLSLPLSIWLFGLKGIVYHFLVMSISSGLYILHLMSKEPTLVKLIRKESIKGIVFLTLTIGYRLIYEGIKNMFKVGDG